MPSRAPSISVIVAGATSPMGRELVTQLVSHPDVTRVVALSRHPIAINRWPSVFPKLHMSDALRYLSVVPVDWTKVMIDASYIPPSYVIHGTWRSRGDGTAVTMQYHGERWRVMRAVRLLRRLWRLGGEGTTSSGAESVWTSSPTCGFGEDANPRLITQSCVRNEFACNDYQNFGYSHDRYNKSRRNSDADYGVYGHGGVWQAMRRGGYVNRVAIAEDVPVTRQDDSLRGGSSNVFGKPRRMSFAWSGRDAEEKQDSAKANAVADAEALGRTRQGFSWLRKWWQGHAIQWAGHGNVEKGGGDEWQTFATPSTKRRSSDKGNSLIGVTAEQRRWRRQRRQYYERAFVEEMLHHPFYTSVFAGHQVAINCLTAAHFFSATPLAQADRELSLAFAKVIKLFNCMTHAVPTDAEEQELVAQSLSSGSGGLDRVLWNEIVSACYGVQRPMIEEELRRRSVRQKNATTSNATPSAATAAAALALPRSRFLSRSVSSLSSSLSSYFTTPAHKTATPRTHTHPHSEHHAQHEESLLQRRRAMRTRDAKHSNAHATECGPGSTLATDEPSLDYFSALSALRSGGGGEKRRRNNDSEAVDSSSESVARAATGGPTLRQFTQVSVCAASEWSPVPLLRAHGRRDRDLVALFHRPPHTANAALTRRARRENYTTTPTDSEDDAKNETGSMRRIHEGQTSCSWGNAKPSHSQQSPTTHRDWANEADTGQTESAGDGKCDAHARLRYSPDLPSSMGAKQHIHDHVNTITTDSFGGKWMRTNGNDVPSRSSLRGVGSVSAKDGSFEHCTQESALVTQPRRAQLLLRRDVARVWDNADLTIWRPGFFCKAPNWWLNYLFPLAESPVDLRLLAACIVEDVMATMRRAGSRAATPLPLLEPCALRIFSWSEINKRVRRAKSTLRQEEQTMSPEDERNVSE